jgi:hypothetical protein
MRLQFAVALTTLLTALLPLQQTQADQIQLTLNCQVETVMDSKTGQESKLSDSFSAIVSMSNPHEGTATIEATTFGCLNYEGSFEELQVFGECERTVEGINYHAWLRINRVTGAFEHTLLSTRGPNVSSNRDYWGHCTPAKKLF